MGQAEVMEVLKREKRRLTSKAISEILKANLSLVNRALNKLYKHGAISRRTIKNSEWHFAYEYQIK